MNANDTRAVQQALARRAVGLRSGLPSDEILMSDANYAIGKLRSALARIATGTPGSKHELSANEMRQLAEVALSDH